MTIHSCFLVVTSVVSSTMRAYGPFPTSYKRSSCTACPITELISAVHFVRCKLLCLPFFAILLSILSPFTWHFRMLLVHAQTTEQRLLTTTPSWWWWCLICDVKSTCGACLLASRQQQRLLPSIHSRGSTPTDKRFPFIFVQNFFFLLCGRGTL